jgi:hypothetical protein
MPEISTQSLRRCKSTAYATAVFEPRKLTKKNSRASSAPRPVARQQFATSGATRPTPCEVCPGAPFEFDLRPLAYGVDARLRRYLRTA